jgi:DNA-binding transcriptional MerR regulator
MSFPQSLFERCIMGKFNPSKIFYRVGEVSQLVGVESYVLRYWEKMFPQLNPEKDENGQRVYTKDDIEVILRIKNLLYEERYTIDGARKRLRQENRIKNRQKNITNVDEILIVLRNVRSTLQQVLDLLNRQL